MTTYDNAPPLEGWQVQSRPNPLALRRCCGTFATDLACSICGNWLPTPASIVRGEN